MHNERLTPGPDCENGEASVLRRKARAGNASGAIGTHQDLLGRGSRSEGMKPASASEGSCKISQLPSSPPFTKSGEAPRKSPGVRRQDLGRAPTGPTLHDSEGRASAVGFFTIPEVAGLLALSERHVWRLINREELGCHRFGRATRISEEDLRDYVRRSREKRPKKQR